MKQSCLNSVKAFGAIAIALAGALGAARADVTIAGQNVVRLRPAGVGGTNIVSHSSSAFVTSTTPNYQADAVAAHLPVIRTYTYPDNRTTSTFAFLDAKVQAIVASGAVPVLGAYLPAAAGDNHPYSKPGTFGTYCNADGTITGTGTFTTNLVYLVKHFLGQDAGSPNYNPYFAAHPVPLQYWEVGNEPDSAIDYQATPAYYCQEFQAVHDALVSAGLRENVVLMGPVVSYDYRWSSSTGGNTRMLDYFVTHCNAIVDIVDYHSYSGSGDDLGLLNTPHKMDNFYNTNRPVSLTQSANPEDQYADYGEASMLLRLNNIPFGRPNVGLSITEHNGYNSSASGDNVHHAIVTGLWNLQLTHFLLYNPRGVLDTSFVLDTFGGDQGGFAHYDSAKVKDYAYWSLYTRNNFTGPLLLGQSTTGNLNSNGNPYLLVTATRDSSNLYLEVINRNTAANITDTVHLQGLTLAGGAATAYQLSSGVFPTTGTATTVASDFPYTFPAESATILKIALSPTADFALTAAPVSQEVNPGGSTMFPVFVTPLGGFTGTVGYSVSGLPAGAGAMFSAGTGTSAASLNVSTSGITPVGTYPLTVTATSGALTHTYSVTLKVATPDYQFVVSPTARTIAPGSNYTFTFTAMALGGFTGPINVSVAGLPTGVTAGVPNPHPLDTSGTGTINIAVGTTSAAAGSYPITFTGTSGTLTHSVAATLTVQSVAGVMLAVSPMAQSVTQGSTATYTVTITPMPGYSGTVTLSVTGAPTGATATLNPTTITVPSGSTQPQTSTLTVTTAGNTPTGTSTLTVTSATGSQTLTASPTLTVNGGATVLDATPQVTVTRGGFRFNRALGLMQQVVTLTNNGADLSGPVSLVMDNLTPGVSVSGASGTAGNGSPYQNANLSTGTLLSGASATVAVSFSDPAQTAVNFTPRILAGTGTR